MSSAVRSVPASRAAASLLFGILAGTVGLAGAVRQGPAARTVWDGADDDPGSLPREQCADLVGCILALNRLPAGATEIGTTTEPLRQIRIAASKL